MGMIVTFFRSSSYNAWDICPHKYFISYVLGIKELSGQAADKGNVVHKALELLARYKLAQQNNETEFEDDELGKFQCSEIFPESAIEIAYDYMIHKTSHHTWTARDFDDCKTYMETALNFRNGMFSPLKREVIKPEQYFELIIKKPWAEYDYVLPDGSKMSGYLGIKGTMDLLVKQGEQDYEMIDWKTGAMMDWGKMREKTYDDLMHDPQLRLYHYAATRLYPQIRNIYVTIFYMKAAGPHSLCFTENDLQETEDMLRKRFNVIRNTVRPPLVYPSRKCNFCHYKKYDFNGPVDDYQNSICKVVRDDIVQLGLSKVMNKYGKTDAFNAYGSGGGVTNRENN